jgi:hypothetical protein
MCPRRCCKVDVDVSWMAARHSDRPVQSRWHGGYCPWIHPPGLPHHALGHTFTLVAYRALCRCQRREEVEQPEAVAHALMNVPGVQLTEPQAADLGGLGSIRGVALASAGDLLCSSSMTANQCALLTV